MAGTRNGYIFPPPKSFMQGRGQQATRIGQSLQPPNNGPNFCTQTFPSSPMQKIHRVRFNDKFNMPSQFQNYCGGPSTPRWPHHFVNNNQFHNFNANGPPFTPPPQGGFEPRHMQPRPRNHFMNGRQWRQKFDGNNCNKQNSRSDMRVCHVTASDANRNPPEIVNSCQEEKMLYFCEPCEKEFKTEGDKAAHLKGHVKCEVESCNFVASRKALKLHFIQHHEEGMFKIVLRNDEDIKKWREERKKNYPRVSRQTDLIEKQNRRNEDGNVLNTKEFRYQGRGVWHERTNRNKFQNRNENRRNSWQLKEQNNDMQQKTITKQERNEKANQFKTFPSKEIDIGCTDCSSVESKENEANKLQTNDIDLSSSMKTSALASLSFCYQSSSDSEDEDDIRTDNDSNEKRAVENNLSKDASLEQKEGINTRQNDVKLERVKTEHYENLIANGMTLDSCVKFEAINTRFKGSGTDNDTDVNETDMKCDRDLKENVNRVQNNNTRKRERMSHGGKDFNSQRKRPRQSKPTLLEMLLANDIRHERNIILQALRHIIKNEFFIKKK